jgi:hypothetical protein
VNQRPSRSASAAEDSGTELTTTVSRPCRARNPVAASTRSPSPGNAAGAVGSVHGGVSSSTATAFRAETSARVSFWTNSKNVRIGPTMNSP